jgi:tetratricopeptide (TPR) repeat protein
MWLEIVGFLQGIAASFGKLDSATQIGTACTILGFLALPVGVFVRWYVRYRTRGAAASLEVGRASLEQAIVEKEEARKKLVQELAEARAEAELNIPAYWLKTAGKERESGNEFKAIRLFEDGFEQVLPDFGQVCHELSLLHLSTMAYTPRTGLENAERFSRLATLLRPGDRDAAELLVEIAEINLDDGGEHPPESQAETDDAWDRLFGHGMDAQALVQRFCELCLKEIIAGRSRTAQRFAISATLVAERRLSPTDPVALESRYWRAEVHILFGRHAEALDAVDALLPLREKVNGAEHPDTLSTRFLRAKVLDRLGRHAEALDAVDTLMPLQEKVSGVEHPDTLTTRSQRASVLNRLGRHAEAFDALEALLPLREKVSGAEHPDALTARIRRADVLGSLGRHAEALDAVDALLPLREKVNGAEHPDTLATRYLRAMVLDRLGRHVEALDTLEAVLPLVEKVNSAEHPDTLVSKFLRCRVLVTLARRDTALDELSALVPVMETVLPENHPSLAEARALLTTLSDAQGN